DGRRPFGAVELDHRERHVLDRLEHLGERRIDEDSRDLDPAANRRRELGSRLDVAAARALRIEDRADRPRAELDRRKRVARVGDAADLHFRHGRPIVELRPLGTLTGARPSGEPTYGTVGVCWKLWSAFCGRLPSVTVASRCFEPRKSFRLTWSPGFFESTTLITSSIDLTWLPAICV